MARDRRTVAKKPTYRTPAVAQRALRAGDTTGAVTALEGFAARGETSASASLALVAAYRGHWTAVLGHAAAALAKAADLSTANTLENLGIALRRAGVVTGRWDAVVAALPRKPLYSTLPFICWQTLLAARAHGATVRDAALAAVAPEEPPEPEPPPAPDDVLARRYQEDLAEMATHPRWKKRTPADHLRGRLDLALGWRQWDAAVALFRAEPEAFWYDRAVKVAPLLVARGAGNEAWEALRSRLWSWVEVEHAQVAPTEMLEDDALWSLFTPERGEKVLATPRGTATWNAAYAAGTIRL